MSAKSPDGTLEDLIDELARVLHDPGQARELVLRAGFPSAQLPAFDVPGVFWSRVVRAAADGKSARGVEAIVEQAAALFPGNEFLAARRARNAAPPGMFASHRSMAIDNRSSPAHPHERTEYLAKLLDFDRRRRPLGDLLRDDPLLPSSVTMNAVEVPVFIERDEGPESTDDVEVGPRDLVVVLDELLGKGTRPVLMTIGDVGTGKTTLLEQTMAALARDAQRDPDAPLPFLLSAFDLLRWPDLQTSRARALCPRPALHSDHRGGWVYLIDAWDEVKDRDAAELALAILVREPGTRAVVVASRPVEYPRLDRPVLRYRITPWTRELEARFEAQWATVDPEGRILDGLWGNPLTVTISAAISRLADHDASRAQLFGLLVEKIFDGWAARRQPGRALPWAEIAPAYQRLARTLLEGDQETFSRQEVHAILMREAREQADRAWLDASNELGLLMREPSGRYRFISRPIAEHLAGAGMTDTSYEDFLCIATAAWAEEPARHCIGLLAIREPNRALEFLRRMCDGHGDRRYAPFSLRLATIAVKAVSDLGERGKPVAGEVCDVLLGHLLDETSLWQPAHAGRTIRVLVEGHGLVSELLREKAGERLDAVANDGALGELGVDDLYHRDPIVRLGAIEALSSRRDEPEVRQVLLCMLRDCGWGNTIYQSVGATAGMALRACTRDAHFDAEILPRLLAILSHGEQTWSGAAAVALRPDEAAVQERVEALHNFSRGHGVPSPIVRELEEMEEAASMLADRPLRELGEEILPSTPARAMLDAKRRRSSPSSFVRMSITRTLGTSMIRFDESRLTACIEAACQGVDYDLELLCHLAPEDPGPLVRVLERVSNELRPNPHLLGRDYLRFTPECVEPLRVALISSEPLRAALLRLWRHRGEVPPFLGYPGTALESLVRGGDPEAITVYTEWFPTTLNGVTEPHLVPADLLQVPSIRAVAHTLAHETARDAFEGYDDNGKRMYTRLSGTVEVMHSLRSLWADDPGVCSAIEKGVGCDDLGRALFAISVLGKGHLTDGARRVLSDVISRGTNVDDVERVFDLIQALMLSVSTPISEQNVQLLRELALSEHPARFAAGFALLPALDQRQARELAVELCRRWPNLNWSFYYSRYEELLPALVKPAPSTWASRCKQVGIRDGLDMARLILSRLGRAEREDFLAHLVRCGSHCQLPWLSLAGRHRNERLLDSVLEVVYGSGVGLEAYCGWLGHGFP